MIELRVQPFCHNCKMFEAESTTSIICADNTPYIITHAVTCKNDAMCRSIRHAVKAALKATKEEEFLDDVRERL